MTYLICVSREALKHVRVPVDELGFDPDEEAYILEATKVPGGCFKLSTEGGFVVPINMCAVLEERPGV